MFEDFASSGKGPGLVGILLAFLVLAGFSGMAIAVYYDDGSSREPNIKAKVSSSEVEIEIMKGTLAEKEEKLALFKSHQKGTLEVTVTERRIKQATEESASLEQQKANALAEVESQKLAFEEYRQHYRLAERTAAVGEIVDLSETLGPDYKSVEILGISATLFRVRSSSGPKGIEYEKLPHAILDRFQFSEDEAEQYKKMLAARNKVRNARIAAADQKRDLKKEAQKETNRIARIKSMREEIEKLNIIAEKKRDLAGDYASRARQHMADDRAARNSGKQGMNKALARTDEAKSKRYAAEAVAAEQRADKLAKDLLQISQ